eukprot:TRINITY_DN387_c0_g1_i2.p2 TRINITY_DN387_c0_g1~~TRINITY_DN387_c0_g1_i2.p2  ORF type:complete len:109 (-),score=29.01 TRINITY_DN387_c0_g1_i2:305-631(-)
MAEANQNTTQNVPSGAKVDRRPIMNKMEEEKVLNFLKGKAKYECRNETEEYVQCTHDKGISVVWACRVQLTKMNDCMKLRTRLDSLSDTELAWALAKEKHQNTTTKTT